MHRSTFFALILLAVACGPKTDTPTPGAAAVLSQADIDAVKAVDAAWAAAMNAKDTTALFALYADDANLMPPDSPILSGDAIHAALSGLIAGGATDFVLTPVRTEGVADLAFQLGTATFTMGGGTASVKYAEVLRKGTDGKWRYVVDMFSGTSAPPSPTN